MNVLANPQTMAVAAQLSRIMAQRYRRYQSAGKIARFVYNNRANIKRTAQSAYRFAKRRKVEKAKKAKKQSIGTPKAIGNDWDTKVAKRCVQMKTDRSVATRTLYAEKLTEIPHTTTNSINGRQRNVVNLHGFKITWTVRNTGSQAMNVNYAVVIPRSQNTVDTEDFFRDNTTSRGRDFAIALTGTDFHHSAINIDKYYVLMHKRFTISPGSAGPDVDTGGRNWEHIQQWVSCKRQLRWESTTDTDPIGRTAHFVYWCDTNMAPSGLPTGTGFNEQIELVTFFSEPSNCC